MPPIQLPQTKTVFSKRPYSPGAIDSLFELAKGHAGPAGWLMTAETGEDFLLLFVLQNSPYAAVRQTGDRFRTITLRELFQSLASLPRPLLNLYGINPVLFKCLLVSSQKIPNTAGTSDLLNIEHLLKQVLSSQKEVVLSLRRENELNLFYILKGKLQESYFAHSEAVSADGSPEEQFLEYAFKGTASKPVSVEAFYDVVVRPSDDADLPWREWRGGIVEYYLKGRPELVFMVGKETVEKKGILKSRFTLGRNPNSDLEINDNLASRDHAVIRESGGKYILEDENSRNGTTVNGKKISAVNLKDGDEIQVGDFRMMFVEKSPLSAQSGHHTLEDLETTMVKLDEAALRQAPAKPPRPPSAPVLVLEMTEGKKKGTRFPLKEKTIIGRTKADINTDDPKTSRHHAAIERRGEEYHYTDLKSTNGSLINGREVQFHRLRPGDIIKIGDSAFCLIEENP